MKEELLMPKKVNVKEFNKKYHSAKTVKDLIEALEVLPPDTKYVVEAFPHLGVSKWNEEDDYVLFENAD